MTKQLALLVGILLYSLPHYAQLYINEVVSYNDKSYADNYGEYDDWIEIYNAGNVAINLANYYISDDTLAPLQFKIAATNSSLTTVPANGYLLLWADSDLTQGEHHLGFKLNSGGETIVLTAIDGITKVDQLDYGATTIDQSYGRKPDGASTTFVFSSSTPIASNNNAAQESPPVLISPKGGIKSSAQTVSLITTLPGASIYYTTNGDVPTSSSNYYSGPFTVNTNKSIRAVTIKSGYANSYPTTETYVFNYTTDLPVIFITIPPVDFDSNNDGMYIVGTNGIQDNCTSYDANFNQNWEKEVNITMLEADGSQVINQTAGAQISGGCSRKNPLRSFNIAAKDIYGYSHFKHQLFPNYEQDKFKRFKLRNSGNNTSAGYIRDVVGQKIIEGQVDIDQQRSRPVAAFINGEYWGYYYMRDWISEHYIDENHKIADKDSLDIVRGTYSSAFPIYAGSGTHYSNMWTYFNQQTTISSSEYQYIKDTYIDIDEYLNYNMFQIFVANTDWPGNNQRQWREQNGGVFRYILYDTDFGYSRNTNSATKTYSFWNQEAMDFVTNNTTTGWPNDPASTLVFRKLLTNPEFKNEFIQSFGSLLSIVFPYSRTAPILNSEIAKVATERPEFYTRWDGTLHPDGWTFSVNASKTQVNYDKVDGFLANRPGFMYTHLVDFFNLNGTYELTIPLSSSDNGRVVLNSNSYVAPYNYTGTYFDGIPNTLKAIPNPGFRFSHWLETNQTTATIAPTLSSNTTRTPVFVAALDVVINEIHFHPADSINEKEFVEIHNPGSTTRDLTGYEISSGFCFEFPEGTTIVPNAYVIIAKDASQYSGNGYQVFQWVDSKLSNSGENIVLQNQIGLTVDSVDYSDNFPWPLLADGFGRSMELDYPVPADNSNGDNWHASAAVDGSPGAQNSMPCQNPTPAVVINEINYNSNDIDNPGDWVEITNNSNSSINVSSWKLYDSETAFQIPSGTTIPKNDFLIIAQDVTMFNGVFPHLQSGTDILGGFDFSLSNGGERISLFNTSECPVDELQYNDKLPWDSIPDGNGPTLSLINPASDNSLPVSWEASSAINAALGTPGRANFPCPNFSITVPSTVCKGDTVLLHTATNNDANFTWVIQGGTPATATGDSIYVTFPNAGLGIVELNTTYFECVNTTQSLISVQSCNSPPNSNPDSYTVNEDVTLTGNVLSNDSDPEGQPMTVSQNSGVSNGTLSLSSNGSFSYQPNLNFFGSDAFTYEVCDNGSPSLCVTESVSITINPVNDTPVTITDLFAGLEDSQITGNVLTNDSDVDGDALSATIQTNPTNGTVSLQTNGSFTYTPTANYFGSDQFEYQVCDDGLPSICITETVTISISAVNDTPIATADSYSLDEDNSLSKNVLSNDSDIENNTLTATLISNVTNGSLSLNTNGSFTYTPNLNYNGIDGFTYQVCDNGSPSLCATESVSITINSVNDAPVSNSDLFFGPEDEEINGNVLSNDADVDGNAITATLHAVPLNGTVTLQTNGSFVYTPNANFFGSDQFQYQICDDGSPSICLTETVTLSLNPVNDAPFAVADNYSLDEDNSLTNNVLSNDSDIENNTLTATLVTNVSNGTLSLNANGNFTYTPGLNYNGSDGFTYQVCDNGSPSLCVVESVSITVNSVNDAPIPTSDSYSGLEDNPITGNILSNDSDVDGNNLTATINAGPLNGTVTLQANGSFIYSPNANYFGSDQFQYQICDDGSPSICLTEVVTLSLSPVNDAPITVEDSYSLEEDNSINNNVLSNDSDIENNALTATIVTNVANGTLSLNANGDFTYTPGLNYNGPDGFTYQVCDDGSPSFCTTQSVTITVNAVNDSPITNPDLYTILEDNPLNSNVLTNDSDVDNNTLSAVIVSAPTNGTVTLQTNGDFNYIPTANYFGSDVFVYQVCDDGSPSICLPDTVFIAISSVNDAPIAVADSYSLDEDNSISNNVLTNDSDIENQPLAASLVTNVANGTLSLNLDGSFTYTPNMHYFGEDEFTYEVCDNAVPALCVIDTVSIMVNSVNDAPIAINDSLSTDEATQVAGNVSLNDSDVETANPSFSLVQFSYNGSVLFNFDGSFYYTPFVGFSGIDSFIYEICDNDTPNYCDTATAYINVIPECISIDINLILEGAYDYQSGLMSTTLNTTRSLLPGMSNNPISGQPYSYAPWNYNGNEGIGWTDSDYDATVVDWILVSFRTGAEKSTQVAQTAALVHSDGSVSFPEGCLNSQELSVPIYIVVEHRNHMSLMSPTKLSVVNRELIWDFRSGDGYAIGGTGAKELTPGVWGLLAGDCNQKDDLVRPDINGKDKSNWLLDNGVFGQYNITDINMNGDVNGSDKAVWLLNNGVFGSVKK